MKQLEDFLSGYLRTSLRGALEFLIVTMALIFGNPSGLSIAVGGVLSACGLALRVSASGFGHKTGELVVRGPYLFVRHPFFLGTLLLFVGVAVATRELPVMLFTLPALVLVSRMEFSRDEAALSSSLGPAFGEYRDRVPAFFPQLLPYRAAARTEDEQRSFSLRRAMFLGRPREMDALIGLIAIYALMYVHTLAPGSDWIRILMVAGIVVWLGMRVWRSTRQTRFAR